MSNCSGKCDFLDALSFQVQRTKDGKIYDSKTMEYDGYLVSDIYECFKHFQAKGSKIYQHFQIKKLDKYSVYGIMKMCPELTKNDDGTFNYYGTNYTIKELNKKGGVWISKEIQYRNLLDLVKYFPYLVAIECYIEGKHTIVLSKESYVDEQFKKSLRYGNGSWSSKMYYDHKLSDMYKDISLNYYNPQGHEVREELTFKEVDGKYLAETSYEIDEDFDISWYFDGKAKTHWCSPRKIDSRCIEMSSNDYNEFLGHVMEVKYVKKFDRPLILGYR